MGPCWFTILYQSVSLPSALSSRDEDGSLVYVAGCRPMAALSASSAPKATGAADSAAFSSVSNGAATTVSLTDSSAANLNASAIGWSAARKRSTMASSPQKFSFLMVALKGEMERVNERVDCWLDVRAPCGIFDRDNLFSREPQSSGTLGSHAFWERDWLAFEYFALIFTKFTIGAIRSASSG